MTLAHFRNMLAWELIYNTFLSDQERKYNRNNKKKGYGSHELSTEPPHAKKWLGTKWDHTDGCRYQ